LMLQGDCLLCFVEGKFRTQPNHACVSGHVPTGGVGNWGGAARRGVVQPPTQHRWRGLQSQQRGFQTMLLLARIGTYGETKTGAKKNGSPPTQKGEAKGIILSAKPEKKTPAPSKKKGDPIRLKSPQMRQDRSH